MTLGVVPSAWVPRPSVAAVILVAGQGYLLQHRDRRPNIWYPGYWGLFGGTVEPGEGVEAALLRELREELGFEPKNLHYFLDTTFNFGFVAGPLARSISEIELTGAAVGTLKLLEGESMRIFSPASLQSDLKIVPCDRFVLDVHISQRQKQMALRELT